MQAASTLTHAARPIVGGDRLDGVEVPSVNPANTKQVVGKVQQASMEQVDAALNIAAAGQPAWDRTPAAERAAILNKAADLFEENTAELLVLCVAEAGKTIPDAIAELRDHAHNYSPAVFMCHQQSRTIRNLLATWMLQLSPCLIIYTLK